MFADTASTTRRPQATPTAESLTRREMEARHRAQMDELFREIDLIHQQHQRRTDRAVATVVMTMLLACAVTACVLVDLANNPL